MLKLKSTKAFTLVELILVILIIGILAGIVIPRITYTTQSAKEEACKANKAAINAQVELYYQLEGSWPANDLSDIGADNDYFPDGIPTCPVDSTAYALDANNRVDGHDH